ncbi:SDR family NAD(P)-dependent oxidoreductase [Sorangium sp. So ce367]|uniref:SDR family NAD(P)-dependent oxidoreductase n=1 Tax=Sorangium sp. So ce367 TaxID=3133305 RepID=UPI003F637F26
MQPATALVTGASRGMGRGVAERLDARGTAVALLANTPDLLDDVRRRIEAGGGRATVRVVDVRQTARLVEAVQSIEHELGGLDLVVANAGIGTPVDVRSMCWNAIAPIIETNVLGTFATLTAALPSMLRRGHGHLVAVSSLAGSRGLPTVTHYCASKAAISRFVEGLRIDLAGTGITITDIQPGFVDSAGTGRRSYPTPWMLDLETAVDCIMCAIATKAPLARFPALLAGLMGVGRIVPRSIFERVMAVVVRRSAASTDSIGDGGGTR